NYFDSFKGATIRRDLQLALNRALLLALGKLAPASFAGHPNLRQEVRAAVAMENQLRSFVATISFRRHAQADCAVTVRVGNSNRAARLVDCGNAIFTGAKCLVSDDKL